jgi:ATP-dependent helicase/nuclease subunit B
LLSLTNELLEHLEGGGTLVVPSRQRAAAVRLAYSAAMLGAGFKVWNTPDVLPWSAWVERELDAARIRGESLARRLSAPEEWLLWREAVQQACADLDVLMPDALIEPVRRAIGRLDDYGLPLSQPVTVEAGVLLQARAGFRHRTHELNALGITSWRDCAASLRPSPRLLLAGFPALGRARRHWLEQHGARVAADAPLDGDGESGPAGVIGQAARVIGCDNPLLEAAAAAHWCDAELRRDPRARLLLVVPRLAQQRHLWERALSQQLDCAALLAAGTSAGESPFAIEGGQALNAYPLVATALQLIAVATGPVAFEPLSAVLRSAHLAALDRDQRLRVELWLREHNVGALQPQTLARLVAPVAADVGQAAAAMLQRLIGAIQISDALSVGTPTAWAQAFAQVLSRCGWPGVALGSDEQQVRMRFDELLGEFAAIAAPAARLQGGEACRLLHDMARRVAFEPASDDVPVTVTASLDDPIVCYDGIWVAGLSADIWPPAAQPDPLLPLMLQRDAGLPEASADGQLRLALQRMRQWQRRSRHCVWSWARSEADLPRDASALLGEARVVGVQVPPAAAPCDAPFALQAWLIAQAPPLQPWRDLNGLPWPAQRAPGGGIKLLELQSLCPFRGYAELRLQARPVPQPRPGIDPRLRGNLLHLALEGFWRATGDSATLHARDRDSTLALARRCARTAAEQIAARVPGGIEPGLLRREAARAERLIEQLIDWELTRAAFETQSLEAKQQLQIAGAHLSVKLDRVDRLGDGRLVVIDYKSGAPETFDAFADRPPRPQLLAYAMAAGEAVAAVLAVYLSRDSVKLRGLADRPERLPGRGIEPLPAGESGWQPLLLQWRSRLERLMREFLDGHAVVQPQPGACEYCHLQMLCRVDAQVLAAAAEAAADDAPAAQAAQAMQSDPP